LPLPPPQSNYTGAAPRSPDLLPTALPRGRARLYICSISAIGAVTDQHRRTPQPAPGRRAQHFQHFSQVPAAEQQAKDLQAGAPRIGRQILILNASSERDIDNAFRTLLARQAAGLLVAADPFFNNRREQLVALATYHGIPAIYEFREYALAGGLMTYGTSITDSYRQAGVYAGRILKGEKPSNLPVVQPTKFDLVINLKTAKALGLDIPATVLAQRRKGRRHLDFLDF